MSLRRTTAASVALGVAAGLAVLIPASPASASVGVSTSGTKLVLTMTGKGAVGFSCVGGKVAIVDSTGTSDVTTVATPNLACSALTEVDVTGDAGDQSVYGEDLGNGDFTAKPKLVASLAGGSDSAVETLQADNIDLGTGDDYGILAMGTVANTKFDLGPGTFDGVTFYGTEAADQMTVTSTGTSATYSIKTGGATKTATITNGRRVFANLRGGNDTFTSTGITAASTTYLVQPDGDDGNDTFTIGSVQSQIDGGEGTNTFNLGTGADDVYSRSETDVINGAADDKRDVISDISSLRFGGRALNGFANTGAVSDVYSSGAYSRDVTVRFRPVAGGTLETFSLNRTGQQQVSPAIEFLQAGIQDNNGPAAPHRSLVDYVMGGQNATITGNGNARELFDITTVNGTIATSANATQFTVESGGHAVTIPLNSTRSVHAPWADEQTSFAHRANRDLLFKFLSDTDRTALANKLKAGTTTRAKVVAAIVNSDEYRGLDVDRTFTQYLRRKADSGGRNYWIGSLRSGKALWRFRAQLLGSNEYFTKAGSTNAAFVNQAYTDVLGRKPDPSGATYWTNKLNKGADRGAVALQLLSSTEARRNIVKDQYLRFLDRYPTTPEADTWITKLGTTTTGEQELITNLATSTAYDARN
ncbi:MAG: DUF4214 domain-containing protein [Acidimicrobiales bacterium]